MHHYLPLLGHKHKRVSLSPDSLASPAIIGANNRKQSLGNALLTPTKPRKRSEPTILPSTKSYPALSPNSTPTKNNKNDKGLAIESSRHHSSPDILSISMLKPSEKAARQRNGGITTLEECPDQGFYIKFKNKQSINFFSCKLTLINMV